ncbi:hypothetical protein IJT17_03495 [bacterium]|nr:hypothetical protein [bacterium]
MRRTTVWTILAVLFIGLWASSVCWADEGSPKKGKVKHPLSVLHAALDKEYGDGLNNVKYRCTIWLRNISHNDVDGVKCRLLVRDGAKKYYEETKEIETIASGKRIFVNYKWEDRIELRVTPEIWITYKNSDGEEVEFQAISPTWE